MNSKIKTYLISKGIDFSVSFLVDENHLEKIDEKFIYQNTYFENKLIKYTMLGKKKELFLRKEGTGVPTVAQWVKNSTRIQENASSIPSLAPWVKDLVLP